MSVASKMRKVMAQFDSMAKDGKMQGSAGNYGYLSEEQIVTRLHGYCGEVGLVIAPASMEILTERQDTTSSGKIMHVARILVTYTFIDPDEPESVLVVQALGEGADMGDKCLNKAMTGAFKYALRQSFMISTGDDPDHVASEAATTSVSKPAPKPAPAPTPRDQHHVFRCGDCGKEVRGFEKTAEDGSTRWISATWMEKSAKEEFGIDTGLCFDCVKARRKTRLNV